MSDKVERNPCGHPVACVVTDGTTSHCAWCADQGQFHARIDKLREERARPSRAEVWAMFAAESLHNAGDAVTFGDIAKDAETMMSLYDKRWSNDNAK